MGKGGRMGRKWVRGGNGEGEMGKGGKMGRKWGRERRRGNGEGREDGEEMGKGEMGDGERREGKKWVREKWGMGREGKGGNGELGKRGGRLERGRNGEVKGMGR